MHDLQGWSHLMLSHVFSKFICASIQICQLRRSPCFAKWRSDRRSWTLRSPWLTKLRPWKHETETYKKKHEMTLSTVDMPSCHHGWRGHGIHWIHTFPPIHTFHVSFEKETFTLSLLSSSFHIFRVSEFKGSTRHNFSSCLIWSVWSGNVTVSVRFLSHTPLEHRSAAMKTKKDEDSKTSGIPSFCRIDVSSEWNDYLPDLPGLSRVSDFSSCDLLSDIFFMLSKAAISVPGQAGRCDFNAAQLTEVCFAESFFSLHTFFWGFWCWHNSQTVPLPWSRMAGENIQQLTLHAAWSAANDPQQWLEVGTPNCENWCQFGWNN